MLLRKITGNIAGIQSRAAVVLFVCGCLAVSARSESITVFSTDFNSGLPPAFTGVVGLESVQGYDGLGTGPNVFSGRFLRNGQWPASPTILTITDLPPHDSVDIRFLLAIIDSWDGICPKSAPDLFEVHVDGVTVFSDAFANVHDPPGCQGYDPPPGVALTPIPPTSNRGWSSRWRDAGYNLGLDPQLIAIPHTAGEITIVWTAAGAGWQGALDESWAIDNVEIAVNVVSTPGDLNCDGEINALDIEPFILALFDPDNYAKQYPDCDINNADINGDGNIDALDIEPFLELLFGP